VRDVPVSADDDLSPFALLSISPTFYELLLHRYSFAKKLQSQAVIREKLSKILSYKKGADKM